MTRHKCIMLIVQMLTIGLVAFTMLAPPVAGQGVCVPDRLVIKTVAGRVVSQLNRGETSIPQASVELLEDRYLGRMLAKTTASADGSFKFNKIKSGKYILKVSHPHLATFYGRIQVISSRKKATEQVIIIVTLGADFTTPCGGSSAKLRIMEDR